MYIDLEHDFKKKLDANLKILNDLCKEPYSVEADAHYELPTMEHPNGGFYFEYHLYKRRRFETYGNFEQMKDKIKRWSGMQEKYYTLLIKYIEGNLWGVEFGDFDRKTVEDERDYWRNCVINTWRDPEGYMGPRTKIITTSESQKEIDAIVAKLNQTK